MKKYNILSLIAIILVIFYSSPVTYAENSLNEVKKLRLLTIPLDDRPANTYFPKKVGQSGGVEIILPPSNLINEQTSFNSLQQLSNWIVENSDNVDGFILSADMLTDGGLVNSRSSKQTINEAINQLNIIKILKEKYPTKPLFVYDTIQRLAPTVLKDGNLEKYNLLREWAITYDEVNNLNATNKKEKLKQLEVKIGDNLLNEYMQTRMRNYQINATLIDWTNQGFIDFLILGQDDANSNGLHRVEQEKLIKKINTYNIQHKVSLFDGADEIDSILISRFLTYIYNYQPTYKIHYIGVNGNEWTSPFDQYSLQRNIEKHIVSSGGIIASPNQKADIELYVNTPHPQKNSQISKAIDEMRRQLSNKKNIVFIDVEKVNKANEDFGNAIINQLGITNLLSYSAFNTAGNAIGSAIGHASTRFLFLEKGNHPTQLEKQALEGHIETLLYSITADHLYRNNVEPKVQWYARYIGANAWDISPFKSAVLQFTKELLYNQLDLLHQNVANTKVLMSKELGVQKTAEIESFSVKNIDYPWDRLFEISMEFQVNLKTEK